MNEALMRQLVEATIHAPSVHNVQPARWRIEQDSILLYEDLSRRLRIGDAGGNDASISLGAAAEALHLAAGSAGIGLAEERDQLPIIGEGLRPIARYRLTQGASADPLAAMLERRASWRGGFIEPTTEDRHLLASLAAEDAAPIVDALSLKTVARQFDRASYGFMRAAPFRGELRSWMRLSRRHPRWALDGLNAQAMSLSRLEAFGAGQVLGWLFPLLDRVGVAPALLAEGTKIASAAGVLLFHRPAGEDPFDSGRRFLRLWLEVEALGMGAAVLAALADDREIAAQVASAHGIPPDRRLVSAFRVGRRDGKPYPRARLGIEELLV